MLVFLRMCAVVLALCMIAVVLWDGFESVVLPRRVSRRFRLAAMYARGTWAVWSAVARQSALTRAAGVHSRRLRSSGPARAPRPLGWAAHRRVRAAHLGARLDTGDDQSALQWAWAPTSTTAARLF